MNDSENRVALLIGIVLMVVCMWLLAGGCSFDADVPGLEPATKSIDQLTAEVEALRQQMAYQSHYATGLATDERSW